MAVSPTKFMQVSALPAFPLQKTSNRDPADTECHQSLTKYAKPQNHGTCKPKRKYK